MIKNRQNSQISNDKNVLQSQQEPSKKQIIQLQEIDNDQQDQHMQNQFHSNQLQIIKPLHQEQQSGSKNSSKSYCIFFVVFTLIIIVLTKYISIQQPLPHDNTQNNNKPTKQTNNQSIPDNFDQYKMMKQFIGMGKSKKQPTQLKITIIQKSEIQNNYCSIVNSIIYFPNNFTITLRNLINISKISKIIIYSQRSSQSISKILKQEFNQAQQFIITQQNIQIDSDYAFINKYLHTCTNVAYFQTTFTLSRQQSSRLKIIMNKNPSMSLSYTGFCSIQSDYQAENQTINKKLRLKSLKTVNLQKITAQILGNYLVVFDSRLVNILTPLNFAYYVQYSFEQLLIYPLLAMTQLSTTIYQINQNLHGCRRKYKNIEEIKLNNQLVYLNKSLCFVSYPTNPYNMDENQLKTYIQSVQKMQTNNISISVVVYLPYVFNPKQSKTQQNFVNRLMSLKFSSQHRVKLRLFANKSLSSFAVYQSAYLYCPSKSIMISSRHNVMFKQDFAVELINNILEKYHYYVINYEDSTGNTNFLHSILFYQKPYYFRSNQAIFRSFFKHIQIYKSDLMKMTLFWVLKSAELQFYETQSSFVTYMMQCLRLRFQYINKTLLLVQERQETQIQSVQIQSLTKYVEYSPIFGNLRPYKYNCLENEAFRRFAPERIPRSVHQIWIGNSQISPIRIKLHQTISKNNPTYNINLWRDINITRQNFPYTFQLVTRTLQYQKTSLRSYNALVADLLRYQILYQYGGIYIDFKMEVLKPLDAFLKYEIFFIDAGVDQTRFNVPLAIGIGIIGSMKNSYYLGITLKYLIENERINYQNQNIPQMTGGNVIRKAFSDEQLFNVIGLGYQLFIPKPSASQVNDCLKLKTFSFDQQVFEIRDSFTKISYKVGIPCKEYPQSYIVSYKPLARTWKGVKRKIN